MSLLLASFVVLSALCPAETAVGRHVGLARSVDVVDDAVAGNVTRFDRARVRLARNEIERFQVVVRSARPERGVHVDLAGDLVERSGEGVFSATNVEAYVVRGADPSGAAEIGPERTCDLTADETCSFWVRVSCPSEQRPGVYCGRLRLHFENDVEERPLEVRVSGFALPVSVVLPCSGPVGTPFEVRKRSGVLPGTETRPVERRMTQRNECLLDGLEDRGYLQLLRKAGIEAEVPEEVCAPDCAHSRNPAHLYEWRLSISDVLEEWLPRIVRIRSSADGTLQPAYFHAPAASGPVPLLVGLHTWSYDLTNLAHYRGELAWCRKHGWAFIAPNYRGPNYRKDGCGSELAVRDVVDAVEWAKGKAPIDPDRVYVLGGSGGGHMTLLLAGRHPELWAGCAAFCPIADLAAYHDESLSLDSEYSRHLRSACGGTPQECPDEYARRSPLTYLSHAGTGGVNLYIATGVHDGHKGRGSVPVSHAIRAYNAVAAEADRISDGEMLTILAEERIPGKKGIFEQDPFYGREKAVLLRRRSGNVQLTLFDGGHDCNFPAAYDWLSRQLRGRPADWTLPVRAESVRLEGLSK